MQTRLSKVMVIAVLLSLSINNAYGLRQSVPTAQRQQVVTPPPQGKIDSRLNPKLVRAAKIADERARRASKSRCWRYVKQALVASGVINSYPKTNLAVQAAKELVRKYGFKKLPITDPFAAPIGSVLVFAGGRYGAGHVCIRTKTGFASDFSTKYRCSYKLVGVYGKS